MGGCCSPMSSPPPQAVAATRSRKAKVAALAEALRQGRARRGGDRHGLPRRQPAPAPHRPRLARAAATCPRPRPTPTLTVLEVHDAFDEIAALCRAPARRPRARPPWPSCSAGRPPTSRPGCAGWSPATSGRAPWTRWCRRRSPRRRACRSPAVRRAAMLAGSTTAVAVAALTGGEEALAGFGLEVGRPVPPMLASSAPDVEAALAKAGGGELAVDVKLDGIRIQVHRSGDDVPGRHPQPRGHHRRGCPRWSRWSAALPATTLVLDGEAIALDADGRPRPFQETASRTAMGSGVEVTPYFFDLLHLDGDDLLDAPGHVRAGALERWCPRRYRVPRLVTDDRRGRAGLRRRGARRRARGRRRQEPRRAVRRRPARLRLGQGQAGAHPRPGRAGGRVGQRPTQGLALQHPPRRPRPGDRRVRHARQDVQGHDRRDARLADRAVHRAGARPTRSATTTSSSVRPEQVVEIAFDGVQRSTRYPGGMALRFARVRPLPRRQDRRPRPTPSTRSGSCSAARK